ncbi:MAG: DNA primase [Rhodobacteraceae bacterium]|jgi:DNA primase|nr:DNA primase [Paracoccaceae bacterium]
MSLPPGFLDELRNRLSLAQVVGRKVMWDQRKSNAGKGDFWAPCPFHQEKSASFHVDDRKGYYYCFGCHAKGDAISFVRETENVSFPEAIEILAREAGMPIPERDPRAQEKADRRSELIAVMEQAVQWYRLQLKTTAAAEARDYLARRGLSPSAQERWEIGFAPPGWEGLREALGAKGISNDLMLEAGLLKPSDKGKAPYDTFRNRIMFPIRDARGKAIAFGGRAMDPSDNAKYLNSPETLLFDKGRSLFNHGPAREAAGKGQPLIVAEGYMDVIALSEAGFPAVVAPLGTAITEDQLRLLWRMAPEPIIALDGDMAGLRAAMRAIDVALPLLEAGQSLRFALMPEGQDPDDLIRAQGAGAMRKVIDAAIPMVALLWRRETEDKVFDSPERRAALDKALREKLKLIKDPSIRTHYGEAIKEMRAELFGARRPRSSGPSRGPWQKGPQVLSTTKSSVLVSAEGIEDHLREAVILAAILSTPSVLADFEGEIERMDSAEPTHRQLRDAILRHAHDATGDLREAVSADIGGDVLEKLFAQSHVAISPAVRRAGDAEVARMCLAEELAKLNARRSLPREIAEATEDLAGVADEGVTWRLGQAALALDRAGRGNNEDKAEYDTGPNGAKMKRDERDAFERLLDQINYGKGGRRNS